MFAMALAPLHALPMQDQVTVWFFINLLFCWGCWRECRRIVGMVCDEDEKLAAAWARWSPWLAVAAVAVAVLPTLNCLQRGQVGLVKLYFLLLGVRLILGGRSYRTWIAGGIALAVPMVLKIIPALPVGFVLFLLLVDFVRQRARRTYGTEGDSPIFADQRRPMLRIGARAVPAKIGTVPRPALGRRFAASTAGVCFGLVLFFFLVPAAMVGWNANMRNLDTWAQFMLTKADDGGMDPRSGNSHSSRNQSLQNATYRLGNFAAHVFGGGPDDRLVEEFNAPAMAMDPPEVERTLLVSRAALRWPCWPLVLGSCAATAAG